MDNKHPLMKHALKQVQKYTDDIDLVLEMFDDGFAYAMLTFDFELLKELKEKVNETLLMIDKYLLEQDQKYEELIEKLKMFGMNDDSKCLALLWDFKRPIVYRAQKLNEYSEAINKILT